MGFGEKCLHWIHSCLYNSTMSVLVNESLTRDFMMHKGLKQGDPLSLFLFLMAAGGLGGMVQKAVYDGILSGF